MSIPHDSDDAFSTIADHITVLSHQLHALRADITTWPDYPRGPCIDPLLATPSDVGAQVAVGRLDVALHVLDYVTNVVHAARSALGPSYSAGEAGESAEVGNGAG